MFGRREHEPAVMAEPQPLGVEVDPASAALYDEFAQGRRSLDQVYILWKDPEVTDPTIRQRAVTVLTAPHGYQLPYPHSDQSIGRLLAIHETIDGQETSSLRDRLSDRPELAEELAQGLSYWLDTTGGRIIGDTLDSRYDYHLAIRQLLPIVSEYTADKLFAYLPLNDIRSFYNMDSASGYRPLANLLRDTEVPRKYKDRGLAQWMAIAGSEVAGKAQPREEHERATDIMAQFIETWSYGNDVDPEINTAIVGFLESCLDPEQTYVASYSVSRVAQNINDEDTLFKFAWRHMSATSEEGAPLFRIDNDADLALVKWLRKETDKRGVSVYGKFSFIDELLTDAYREVRRENAAKQAAELALQARLRA